MLELIDVAHFNITGTFFSSAFNKKSGCRRWLPSRIFQAWEMRAVSYFTVVFVIHSLYAINAGCRRASGDFPVPGVSAAATSRSERK
jgi:hypothetical protein